MRNEQKAVRYKKSMGHALVAPISAAPVSSYG